MRRQTPSFIPFLLAGALTAPPALADTRVYVRNLTGQPITLDAPTLAGGLSGGAVVRGATTIEAGKRAEVLRLDRSEDIRNHREYGIATPLRAGTLGIELRQHLRGTLFHSKMWWSLAGPGRADPWWDDRGPRTLVFDRPAEGDRIEVTYSAYFTGGDDDIEYDVARVVDLPAPAATGPDTLSVLAYNVQFLPEFPSGPILTGLQRAQSKRVGPLIEAINAAPRYDAIIFSEAFDESVSTKLFEGIAARYPYRTKKVGSDHGIRQDGGVAIVSRWPITAVAERTYGSHCTSDDCRADKGVIYARLDKEGRDYHLFGTHTQAGYADLAPGVAAGVRAEQFRIVRELIDSLGIPASDPVLIGGDFNVNGASQTGTEYLATLARLDAIEPPRGSPFVSSDGGLNGMTGDHANMLDYVLFSRAHLAPIAAEARVALPRASAGYAHEQNGAQFQLELSDHFPVVGVFRFPERLPRNCETDPTLPWCQPADPDDGCTTGPNGKICR